jgi:hypothetical protein
MPRVPGAGLEKFAFGPDALPRLQAMAHTFIHEARENGER